MEIGSSARVAVLPVVGEAPRVTSVAPPEAVRTELPAQATVQQTVSSRTADGDGRPPKAPDVSRELTIDAKTQEVVFKAIDTKSGEVIRQVPDQALLRIKAYARELRHVGSAHASDDRVERIA